jgi:hypothetical protein
MEAYENLVYAIKLQTGAEITGRIFAAAAQIKRDGAKLHPAKISLFKESENLPGCHSEKLS